ncbi:hypothetical protein [[Leptolyngbya] sp. PCC 7376]|uniref:hypothetical protein n=1 Tax=[Leptolyngbya] sp. PCC 7376 TaxID=111781 RepID=UPI00030F4EDC|nr:hypothetical protein [[Leptolyngbya] sp. PCC 7376]
MKTSSDQQQSSQQTARPKSVELVEVDKEEAPPKQRTIPLPSWHFLGLVLILLSGGVGFAATSILLSFNGSSNCNALYVPLASATTRLYCAQVEAEQQTLGSYLKAIRMVDGFPQDHPLRPDIDRNIEVWTSDILELAEVQFQEGNLDEAIAIAEEVPVRSTARILVEERIEDWRLVWRDGERIFAKLDREINDGDLSAALRTAVELSYLENIYWSTVKYEEARNQIQLARKENEELDVAYVSHRRGGIENWLQAIEQASKISEDSYAYPQAQKLIDDSRENIIRYIEDLVDQQQWDQLMSLSDRLPGRLNLDNMVVDWKILAQAGLSARRGSVIDLETALVQIQSIQPSSSVYDQSQTLMNRWQSEIADVTLLEQGDAIAAGGTITDLQRAIAKLNLIEEGNPRYGEARRKVAQWREKIEISEDRPTLQYARDLASSRGTNALNEAIVQARKIQPGRALYDEAQSAIREWQGTIERREDQPIYDQAIALGNNQRYSEAITVANQITAGRALYPKMQEKVGGWRRELTAATKLRDAYNAASRETISGLVEAIRLTQEIPSSASAARSEGREAANQWSYGILNEAQRQANTASIPEAIATAELIPSGTAAYSSAQVQIEAWERLMRPAPPVETSENDVFLDPQI